MKKMSLNLVTVLFFALGLAVERALAFRTVDGALVMKVATCTQIQF